MRVTLIDKSNAKAFSQMLKGRAATGSALEQLKNLNPHIDFKNIKPGSVVLLPEAPAFDDAESSPVSGGALAALRERLQASIDATLSRVRENNEALLAEQKEVTSLFRLAAVKRALEADAELQPQIELAQRVFKEDQQQARDVDKTMQALQEQATAELDALAELLA
jgi:hypothetical protein